MQCDTWRITRIIPGGISEYILIPGLNLEHDTIRISDDLSYEDATLIEPAACVIKALKRARIVGGETVLIIGLGVMGQMHILLAKEYGAERVIGVDMVPYRLMKAKEMSVADEVNVKQKIWDYKAESDKFLREATRALASETKTMSPLGA